MQFLLSQQRSTLQLSVQFFRNYSMRPLHFSTNNIDGQNYPSKIRSRWNSFLNAQTIFRVETKTFANVSY